jgi:hypothetical protein
MRTAFAATVLFPIWAFTLSSAYGESGEYMIVCEGTTTRYATTTDGRTGTFPAEADTKTFKIGPNTINTKKCQVSTDSWLTCTRPKTAVKDPQGGMRMTHIAATHHIDRYSAIMKSSVFMFYDDANIASIEDRFVGNCRRAKKRL